METKQNKLYVLVGVPGSGKSTWIANQEWARDCVVASTDFFVELEAAKRGKTYAEIFKDYMPEAVELMTHTVELAAEEHRDIIWDQTSTTVASRAKKTIMLPDYYKIAVVFRTHLDTKEHDKRLMSRQGKPIPQYVIDQMIDGWQEPTKDEGFDEIWYAQ